MVQDQLDPEYYEAYDSQGRSKHFGDHCINNDCDMEPREESKNCDGAYGVGQYSDCLAERIPLVVVPIPFASDWLVNGIRGRNSRSGSSSSSAPASQSAVVSPVSAVKGDRKRGFDDVDEDETMSDDNPSPETNVNTQANQPTKQKTIPGSEENGAGKDTGEDTTDWWPAGTCGTSMDDCPVLAKLCYDELLSLGDTTMQVDGEEAPRKSKKQHPLLLNDLVSFVGVVSMNPWEADFSGQQSNSGTQCFGWDSVMAQTDTVPPPSRLPRLHVLSYRKLDLDELARRAVGMKDESVSNDIPEREMIVCDQSLNGDDGDDSDDESVVEWSGFPTQQIKSDGIPSALQDGLASMDAAPWMRSLWLCLLSEAERRRTISEFETSGTNDDVLKIVRAGPGERALGCVSLQLSTPDVASARSLYRDLAANVLPEVCPLVATVDLTDAANTSVVPRKNINGRLTPCPLQLPRGSVVLVYSPPSRINSTTRNNRSKNGGETQANSNIESVQTILGELVQHHRLPYKFEGGVTISFEADYRVIVVTTQTQELPCTLSALTSSGSATPSPLASASTPRKSCPTKPKLREILVKGRSLNNSNDELKYSSLLLEQAQKDFLERRRRCHEESPSSPLPGEDDFHRWLTMTRLQTKSRYARDERANSSNQYIEPSVNDWESALKLDDDLGLMV